VLDRTIRYQAAIIRDDHVLLLRVIDRASGATFWLLPGGGMEAGETAEACVQREVMEETGLHVNVERLLFVAPDIPAGVYQHLHTYLCRVRAGEAYPGSEPEIDTPGRATIQEVGWFDLRAPATWHPLITNDPITFPLLQRVRLLLGYGAS
jgi:ADP-ribose pyrophosphatase YjhB (NUDIX family)